MGMVTAARRCGQTIPGDNPRLTIPGDARLGDLDGGPSLGLGSFEAHRRMGGPRDPDMRSYLDRLFPRLRCGGRLRLFERGLRAPIA